jgi:hypothetical protein
VRERGGGGREQEIEIGKNRKNTETQWELYKNVWKIFILHTHSIHQQTVLMIPNPSGDACGTVITQIKSK